MNREYSCLMVKVKFNNWQKILDSIPDNLVYELDNPNYGKETETHCTVLYGLDKDLEKSEIFSFIKEHVNSPIKLKVSKASFFNCPDYDVLKLDVVSSDLKKLNKKIRNNFEYHSDYPEYNPHITIAYIKKGESDKIKLDLRDSKEISTTEFLFSCSKGKFDLKLNLS